MRPTVVLAVALLAVLAGCGGGGTGGPGTPTTGDATATTAPTPTPPSSATPPPTTVGTTTPDPRPAWVGDDGGVDGEALARLHGRALPATARLTVDREGPPDLRLWTGPDASRLAVGDGPSRALYDAGAVSASRDADATPSTRYERGLGGASRDAAYASVRGTFPGAYLRAATLAYDGPTGDGGHRVTVTGLDGETAAPGAAGRLVALSGTARVGPDGLVRTLSVVETVRTPDGDRVERAVEVRVGAVDAVPTPGWLDAVPRLRAERAADGQTLTVEHVGGATLENGTTLRLLTETGVAGRVELNASLAPGDERTLALVAENGTRRLVVATGAVPENATRLPSDLVVAVDTDVAAVRVAVDADADYVLNRPSNSFAWASARCSANVETSMSSVSATSVAVADRGYSKYPISTAVSTTSRWRPVNRPTSTTAVRSPSLSVPPWTR